MSSGNGSVKIRVEGATKVYETKTGVVHALEDVSVGVRDGELVCVLGPSGCGKTTLLWAMSGLHALTRGRVMLDGSAVTGRGRARSGWSSRTRTSCRGATCGRTSSSHSRSSGESRTRRGSRSSSSETGLVGFDKAYPRELSGGMQQRASIVRALAQDPAVLLMDEPFGALDAFTRDEMNLLLLRLWEETRKTIVFVTHNISEAIFLADRVVVMTSRPGRVAQIYEIDLPRPRTIEMTFEPGFIRSIQEIKHAVESGGRQAVEVE